MARCHKKFIDRLHVYYESVARVLRGEAEVASIFPNTTDKGRFRERVSGKQVHDARLVAMMLAWQIDSILTLNDRDFRRYEPEGIRIVTPDSLTSASP